MIVICASRKGGVGKSTILCNLAGALALAKLDVIIVDVDPQGTASNWCHARANIESVNPVLFIPAAAGKGYLKTIRSIEPKCDVVLVDLQGADVDKNRYILPEADIVIFPFKPSQPDLDQLPWVKENSENLLEFNPAIKIYYVLNEAPTATQKEKNEALAYFAEFDLKPIDTIIHSRKVYRDSMALGLSVCELHDEKAKAEIEGLLAALSITSTDLRRLASDDRRLIDDVVTP